MGLNAFSISGITLAITCFFFTIFLFITGRTKLHRVWAYFNLVVGLWGAGAFFVGVIKDKAVVLDVLRLVHVPITFIPILNFHVVYLLCGLKSRRILQLVYLQGIFFSCCSLSLPGFIPEVRLIFHSFYYHTAGRPIFYYYFFFWSAIVIYSHILLFQKFRNSVGRLRTQILYFFVGTAVGFSGGITNFFPVFNIGIYPFGNFLIPIYCLIVTYAILKYRLMDVKLALTRTSIFVAVYSLVLGVPFAIGFGLQGQLRQFLGGDWWMVPLISSTVLATAGPYIYLYIQKKAENRLLQEQHQYQNTLRRASFGMGRVKDLKRLLDLIVHIVTHTVKIEHCSIYLLGEGGNQYALRATKGIRVDSNILPDNSALIRHIASVKEPVVFDEISQQSQDFNSPDLQAVEAGMKALDAALVVPIFVRNRLKALLVLGKKESGKIYNSDDIAVFAILANQSALGIENALQYAEMETMQRALYQKEKLAYVGQLASVVAHEIRNPLTTIKTFWEYLPLKYNEPEFKRNFETLVPKEISRMEGVVNDLLDLARPLQLKKEAVKINDILNETLMLAKEVLDSKRVRVEKDFVANDVAIYADAERLKQVFLNLIQNASQAMDNGGILTLRTELNDSRFTISISDTGCGMPPETLDKIFTPFMTTKKDGVGLGLIITKDIITEHGGSIAVESEVGKGTKITIHLPM
ncbi:MAG: GAF domain-containing protein [Candidatus Omnitrophica bacterium]|nr:GAF domain-containing protein [Candidatus Omnitrophota bacterium]